VPHFAWKVGEKSKEHSLVAFTRGDDWNGRGKGGQTQFGNRKGGGWGASTTGGDGGGVGGDLGYLVPRRIRKG